MEEFWDRTVADDFRPRTFQPETFLDGPGLQGGVSARAMAGFLSLLGPVEGLNVLDVGCGNGFLSVYLAQLGAAVTAVDSSERAVANTRVLADANGVGDRIRCQRLDALELDRLDRRFDLVTGIFILHHVEPLREFARALHQTIEPGGRALFYENSSRNPLLMLVRNHLVGRFGIPKFRDEDEVPLEPHELDVLADEFTAVEVHVPGLVLFELVARYLFANEPHVTRATVALDTVAHRFAPLRRFSYHQVVELRRV